MGRTPRQPAFDTRDDMKAKQISALITVLQAGNSDYNITRYEVEALIRILSRYGITVAAYGANQITSGPANVEIRQSAELVELGIPAEAPLYYQIAVQGEWHEAAPILATLKAADFNIPSFSGIWHDLQPNNPTDAFAACMNVDGRAIGQTVDKMLEAITAQELAKIPSQT